MSEIIKNRDPRQRNRAAMSKAKGKRRAIPRTIPRSVAITAGRAIAKRGGK